jgi:hypothetical protein
VRIIYIFRNATDYEPQADDSCPFLSGWIIGVRCFVKDKYNLFNFSPKE